jgi:hypothetical protein
MDYDPLYVFLWHMLKYLAYPRRIVRIYDDEQLKMIASGDRKRILDAAFGTAESEEEDTDNISEYAGSGCFRSRIC